MAGKTAICYCPFWDVPVTGKTNNEYRNWSLAALLFLILSFQAGFTYGQSDSRGERQTRKSEVLSVYAFKPVSEARKAMEEEDYDRAIKILEELLEKDRKLKPYDKAMSYQLMGFIFINKENYKRATGDFERALKTQALDQPSMINLRYTLAQLYSSMEQFEKSIVNLEIWFRHADNPGARAFFLAAQVYALSENFAEALSYAKKGMSIHEKDSEEEPRENWYRLMLAIYLQLDKYRPAVSLLEKMISLWPSRPDYYLQLAGTRQQLGDERKSFAVLILAYNNGLLTRGADIQRLAQLHRYHGYPYKAAIILQEGMKAQSIEENKKNWEEMGNAWMQSKEWELATVSLKNAAELSTDGKLWLLLCQTSMQDERWNNSKKECLNAIDKGGLEEEEGRAWQSLAVSRYETGDRDSALRAFRKCSQIEKTKRECSAWSNHIVQKIEKEISDAKDLKLAQLKAQQRKEKQDDEIRRALMQSN